MEATKTRPTMNFTLVAAFVNSVQSVFSTMVGVATEVEEPIFKPVAAPSYDVSGIVGFSGSLVGSVVVSFQRGAAIRLVEAFSGTSLDSNSEDFADAVGELANMIAGAAKQELGSGANITIPSVIIGTGHHVARLKDVPCVVIPVKTAAGDFAVEVCIKQAHS